MVCDVENLESWMQNAENIWFSWLMAKMNLEWFFKKMWMVCDVLDLGKLNTKSWKSLLCLVRGRGISWICF
jgi:hypothetical protein